MLPGAWARSAEVVVAEATDLSGSLDLFCALRAHLGGRRGRREMPELDRLRAHPSLGHTCRYLPERAARIANVQEGSGAHEAEGCLLTEIGLRVQSCR